MPRLPGNFTADLGGAPISGGRRAEASDFGAEIGAAGQALGRAGVAAGEKFLAEMEQDDARRLIVEHAKLRQKYGKALEDAEISGADIDPIREAFEAEASELRGQAGTKYGVETADIHSANSLNVFDTRSAQVKATRAGIAARTQGEEWLASNGRILATNPAYLGIAESEAKAFAQTFAGKLSPEKIAELEQGLVRHANAAAVRGLIRIDPIGAKKRLEDGEFQLTPEMRSQEIARAEAQRRAVESDRRTQLQFAEWEKKKGSQEARDDYTKHIFNGTFRPGEAVADPRLDAADREHLMVFNEQWADRRLGKQKQSNPTVVRDLMLRVYAPEGSPDKVYEDSVLYEPLRKGDLNATDYDRLRRAIAEQRDPNNSTVGSLFHGMQSTINRAVGADPTYIGRPHIVAAITNGWAAAVREKMALWRTEGKSPVDLFNPASGKDYVGDPGFIAQFVQQATAVPGQAVVKVGDVQEKDGIRARFLGGDPRVQKNWEVIPAKQPDSFLILPKSGITVRWTGQGDKNDLANWEPIEVFKPSGADISQATARTLAWKEEARRERAAFFDSLMGGK
jgi:hypothetical protein